jgi:ribose 5-phosphate isomerase B
MKIIIGCDLQGYYMKLDIIKFLRAKGHEIYDVGADSPSQPCDYPDYAQAVGRRVASGEYDRGVLICGTGQGMAIAANKVKGVRAALCYDVLPAIMSREHNNANVLCTGAWIIDSDQACRVVNSWLGAFYSGGRHEPRIAKLEQ